MDDISDQYIIDFADEIGRGTFGSVYSACHKNDKTKIAVKKILFSQAGKRIDALHKMAWNEVTALDCLKDHPNIVRLLGRKEDECKQALYIYMDFCDLGNLCCFMNNKNPKVIKRLEIMEQCLNGIEFMHSKNIVHRDIKPANILMKSVGDDALVKVSDFGFGKILADDAFRKGKFMETFAGTAHFMPPEFFEHIEKGKPLQYDPSIDVFSLGLLFHTILLHNAENNDMLPRTGTY